MTVTRAIKFAGAVGIAMAAIAGMSVFLGCDNGGGGSSNSSSSSTTGAAINVVGYWEGNVENGSGAPFSLNLQTQDGDAVTGRGGHLSTVGTLTGTVSGNVLTFTIVWPAGSTVAGLANNGVMTGTATFDLAAKNGKLVADPSYFDMSFVYLHEATQ